MNRIIKFIIELLRRNPSSPLANLISDDLCLNNENQYKKSSKRVAIQVSEDSIYFGIFSKIIQDLQRESDLHIDLIVTRSINGSVGVSFLHMLARHPIVGHLISSQWVRLFKKLNYKIGYRSSMIRDSFINIKIYLRAKKIINHLKSGQINIIDLKVNDIYLGDLVIDTFLRYKPRADFDLNDRFLFKVIYQAIIDVERSNKYFSEKKPDVYLTSYSTYIQHGIAVRCALKNNISVYSFGSLQFLYKKLSKNDWFHTPFSDNYRNDFIKSSNSQDVLKLAESLLCDRLSGKIDDATKYMNESAYSSNGNIGFDVTNYMIIYLHDFYDSPHVYDDLIFNDFWEWATHTINFLKTNNINFAIKTHPNQKNESVYDINRLIDLYPEIKFIPNGVNTKDLVNGGISCGITVYGSVANELAYLGLPTICCAKHPHHSFNFCFTAKNIKEYEGFLLLKNKEFLDKNEMKNQALACYYMHNLNGSDDFLKSRKYWSSFFAACGEGDYLKVKNSLCELTSTDQYKRLIKEILQ